MNDDISLEPPLAMLQPFPYDNTPSIPFIDDNSPAKPLTSDNSSKQKPAAKVCRFEMLSFQADFFMSQSYTFSLHWTIIALILYKGDIFSRLY